MARLSNECATHTTVDRNDGISAACGDACLCVGPRRAAAMSETVGALLLLSVISGCVVVVTVTLVLMAMRLDRTLTRVNRILPECTHTVKDARQVLLQVRQLLSHTSAAAQHVEAMVGSARETVQDTLEQLHAVEQHTKHLIAHYFGNGTRGEPRRRVRRHPGA